MSFHQRDEIRWNKKGYFERFDGKKYWRKLCVIEGCMKRAKVLNWCKRVSLIDRNYDYLIFLLFSIIQNRSKNLQ
jgi:hypothetical protein